MFTFELALVTHTKFVFFSLNLLPLKPHGGTFLFNVLQSAALLFLAHKGIPANVRPKEIKLVCLPLNGSNRLHFLNSKLNLTSLNCLISGSLIIQSGGKLTFCPC